MWAYVLSLLTSFSADPHAEALEHPRAAAAVAVAYASLAPEAAPPGKDDKKAPAAAPCVTGTCKPGSASVLR